MNDKNIFKNQTKRSLCSKTWVYTNSKSIQEDSAITQTIPATLNIPQKGKNQGIHDCLHKVRVYMWLLQENPRVHTTVKEKPTYRKKKG